MKQIVAGIVAHVDAGKTTLSEALLYRTGEIRKLGRVDHGDAFLDTNSLEKARGITIFAHQALVEHGDLRLTPAGYAGARGLRSRNRTGAACA